MGQDPIVLVVIDSNVLLSALISPYGAPHRVFEAWLKSRFAVVTCEEQLSEIRRASRYPKLRGILKPHLVGRMMNSLSNSRVIEKIPRRHAASDPADAYLLDLAETAKADYLITGDKRSGLLQHELAGIRILDATKFCAEVLG